MIKRRHERRGRGMKNIGYIIRKERYRGGEN
jgi:hypothetical protein